MKSLQKYLNESLNEGFLSKIIKLNNKGKDVKVNNKDLSPVETPANDNEEIDFYAAIKKLNSKEIKTSDLQKRLENVFRNDKETVRKWFDTVKSAKFISADLEHIHPTKKGNKHEQIDNTISVDDGDTQSTLTLKKDTTHDKYYFVEWYYEQGSDYDEENCTIYYEA